MIKILVLAAALAPAGANAQQLDGVSEYELAFAKRHGFHEAILAEGQAKKLSGAELSQFYSSQARAKISGFFAPYARALMVISSNPRAAFDRYSKQTPSEATLLFKSIAAQRARMRGEAMNGYNTLILRSPNFMDGIAYRWRGSLYEDSGELENAAADYSREIEISSGNPAALLARGGTYFAMGYYLLAAQDTARALANSGGEENRRAARGELCEALAFRGYRLPCADLNAEGAYEAQISTPPASELATRVRQTAAGAETAVAESEKILTGPGSDIARLTAASEMLGRPLEKESDTRCHFLRGIIKLRLAQLRAGTFAAALPDLKKAAVAGSGWAWHAMFRVWDKYGEPQLALACAQSAVAGGEENPFFYNDMARARAALGQYRDARASLRKFFKLNRNRVYGEHVSSGPECRTLALEGYKTPGCRDKAYFAAGGEVSAPEWQMPPSRAVTGRN
ncbi:MAG: hypothetical protein WC421_07450 [Elusimicrobiales bacterium]